MVKSDCKNGTARLVRIRSKISKTKFHPQNSVIAPSGFTPINAPKKSQKYGAEDGFQELLITPWHPVKIDGVWTYPCHVGVMGGVGEGRDGDSGCEGEDGVESGEGEEMDCEAVYSILTLKSQSSSNSYISNSSNSSSNNSHNTANDTMTSINTANKITSDSTYGSTITINGIQCITLAHGLLGDEIASHPFFGTRAVEKELKKCQGWGRGFIHFGVGSGGIVLNSRGDSDNNMSSNESDYNVDSNNMNHMNDNNDYRNRCIEVTQATTTTTTTAAAAAKERILQSDEGPSGCLLRDCQTGLANGFILHREIFHSL